MYWIYRITGLQILPVCILNIHFFSYQFLNNIISTIFSFTNMSLVWCYNWLYDRRCEISTVTLVKCFRLTVPYIFTLGLVEISMKWFYYNSVFDPPADDHFNCPNYWWRNLLYVNTLFPVKEMVGMKFLLGKQNLINFNKYICNVVFWISQCMLWSWYLADDTQFYILGIVLLILAVR